LFIAGKNPITKTWAFQ